MTTELLLTDAAPEGGGPDLVADVHHAGAVCVVRLCGRLDLTTLDVLQRQFDRLGRAPCRQVVLDLTAVTAIDPAGARLLTGLHHYVAGRGGHLTVVGSRPALAVALAGTALAA